MKTLQTIYHKKNEIQEVESFKDKECTEAFDFMDKKDLYIELVNGDITPLVRLRNQAATWQNIYTPYLCEQFKYYEPLDKIITLNDITPTRTNPLYLGGNSKFNLNFMNQKNYSIFKALEQYPNISVEEFEPEFLEENVMNKTQKINIKDCGKVVFELLLAPPFGVAVKSPMGNEILSQEKAYVYLEEYCSVVDLTKAPTYLEKIRTEEVIKSLENELKEIKK